MNSATQADNITMSGGGLYSLATIGAKHVIDKATPMLLKAVDQIPAPTGSEHWCFSDMGCADGGTSLDLWRAVAQHLRKDSSADIQIVYADQARNDFNALVQILHGLTQFDSYLTEFENLHVLESGSSFYSPILPAASLHLGFSATAMHWLREKPCNITDHVHMVGATGQELQTFADQAHSDWKLLLQHRSRELKSGGRLVLVNFCRDESGQYLGNTNLGNTNLGNTNLGNTNLGNTHPGNTGGINMFDNFNRIWQTFVDDGAITSDEYHAMTLPQYYNTVEEFSQPLLDTGSEVYKSGLRLSSIETAVVACPFAEDFKKHGDAKRFAREYIPTIRSWNESIYFGALSAQRPEQERRELIEAYYQTYQHQVESDPQHHGMGYVHAYTSIEKV